VYFRFLGFWDNTLLVVVNRAIDVSVLTASINFKVVYTVAMNMMMSRKELIFHHRPSCKLCKRHTQKIQTKAKSPMKSQVYHMHFALRRDLQHKYLQ